MDNKEEIPVKKTLNEAEIRANAINAELLAASKEKDKLCHLCNVLLDTTHTATLQHRFNFILYEWARCRKKVVKNRHGVEVTIALKHINGNGLRHWVEEKKGSHITKATVAQALVHTDGIEYLFTVKNISSNYIYIDNIKLLHPHNYFSFHDLGDRLIEQNKVAQLEPGAFYNFKVRFKPDTIVMGNFKMPVAVQLVTQKNNNFSIVREMVVLISDEDETALVTKGNSPFTDVVWRGIQVWVPPTIRINMLNDYEVRNKIHRKVFKMGLKEFDHMTSEQRTALEDFRNSLLPNYPTKTNYQDFFHILLWVDEEASAIMLQRYNMENVTMTLQNRRKYLELEVPGLAEKRPSLISRDIVCIRIHEDHTVYKGVIRTVTDTTILIEGVDRELRDIIAEYPSTELDVSFQLSRLTYERMHASIDQCASNGMLNCLFPGEELLECTFSTAFSISNKDYFNQDIVNNNEQKTAIENILNSKSGKAPYIVFGPPGTGKTVTIVEAILQIKKQIKNVKILVCAPANAACDMLTSKLIPHCTKRELIRVHSESRDWNSVPKEVKPYSNYTGDEYRKIYPAELMTYKIVVCTLVSSGRYSYNQSYFPDFVFIDEAAQAMEPEATIAAALLKLGKQLILAGDPKQLGPQCASKVAESYCLGVSLLERLMNTPLYQSNNPNFITMLKLNFRAHPDVLEIPNRCFYDNKLIPKSKFAINDPLAKTFIYPKTVKQSNNNNKRKTRSVNDKAAVEFCSVIAKERREGRSPSYFNPNEVEMVLKYIKTIIALPNVKVNLDDIGVVTPYIRQVHRIKDRLKAEKFEDIEVGTTEVFQGREKRVIIISSVRAQDSLLLHDQRYKLGFVQNEKRFNVALTRAKSKLIIIGCPLVLRYDAHWLELMDFCLQRNAYFGAKFDRRTDAEKTDIITRVTSVHSKDSQYNDKQPENKRK